MTVQLTKTIWVDGVLQAVGAKLSRSVPEEAYWVSANLASYVGANPSVFPANPASELPFRRVAFLGDSHVTRGTFTSGNNVFGGWSFESFAGWAMFLSSQDGSSYYSPRWEPTFHGKSGARLAELEAYVSRITPASDGGSGAMTVLDAAPDVVVMCGGTNNWRSADDTSDAGIQASLLSMQQSTSHIISECRENAIPIVLMTLWPPESTIPIDWPGTGGRKAWLLLEYNRWLKRLPYRARGVHVCDAFDQVVDPTSATATAKAGYCVTADVHLSYLGTYWVGAELNRIMTRLLPNGAALIGAQYDRFSGVSALSNQLVDNPLMQGTSGTVSGTGFSVTTTPDNWKLDGFGTGMSVAGSKTAHPAGFGNSYVVTSTTSAADGGYTLNIANTSAGATNYASRVSAGDRLQAECELSLDPKAVTQYVSLALNCFFNGTTQNATFGTASVLTGAFPDIDGIRGVMRTPVVTVPQGTITTVRPQLNCEYTGNGAAVQRWSRVRVVKLNEVDDHLGF